MSLHYADLLKGLSVDGPRISSLTAELASAVPAYLGVRAGQRLNRVTVSAESLTDFNTGQLWDRHLPQALASIGRVIEVEGPAARESLILCARTRAGWLNLNPALLCVVDTGRDGAASLQVCAFAKEGWISQRTAPGAIGRFKRALDLQGIAFRTETIIPLAPLSGD